MNKHKDDIKLVYNEYMKEFKEHDILNKYDKIKLDRIRKEFNKRKEAKYIMYHRYYLAYRGIKDLYDNKIKKKDTKIDVYRLIILRSIWKEEIRKYRLLIKLKRQEARYELIMEALNRIIAYYR